MNDNIMLVVDIHLQFSEDAAKHNQENQLCIQACILSFKLCLITDKKIK